MHIQDENLLMLHEYFPCFLQDGHDEPDFLGASLQGQHKDMLPFLDKLLVLRAE